MFIAINMIIDTMWREITSLILNKKKPVITSVIFYYKEIEDNEDIWELFNDYIVDSIKQIRQSIDDVQYINNVPVINNNSEFDCDNVDNWNTIGYALQNIINCTMETGIFPENWKWSILTPIQKIENRT